MFDTAQKMEGSSSIRVGGGAIADEVVLQKDGLDIDTPNEAEFNIRPGYQSQTNRLIVVIIDGDSVTNVEIKIEHDGSNIVLYGCDGGAATHTIMNLTNQQWYNIRIQPNYTDDTYKIYVDDTQKNVNSKAEPSFKTSSSRTSGYTLKFTYYGNVADCIWTDDISSTSITTHASKTSMGFKYLLTVNGNHVNDLVDAEQAHAWDSAQMLRFVLAGRQHFVGINKGDEIKWRAGYGGYCNSRDFHGYVHRVRPLGQSHVEVFAYDELSMAKEHALPTEDWRGHEASFAVVDMLKNSLAIGSDFNSSKVHGTNPLVSIEYEDGIDGAGHPTYWSLIKKILDLCYDKSTFTNIMRYHLWMERDGENDVNYIRFEKEPDLTVALNPLFDLKRGTLDAFPRVILTEFDMTGDDYRSEVRYYSKSDDSKYYEYENTHAKNIFGRGAEATEFDTYNTDEMQARAWRKAEAMKIPPKRYRIDFIGAQLCTLNSVISVDMPEAGIVDKDFVVTAWRTKWSTNEHSVELGERQLLLSDRL